ncbi:hypothetical protein JTB14_008935 [Gonioctena quinquepunctata]|nr:hypothetical protein JTB14_008935 [Gonioctena quinquepunctata]
MRKRSPLCKTEGRKATSMKCNEGRRLSPKIAIELLKIFQCNLNRSRAAHDMALIAAAEKEVDIVVVSEPNKRLIQNQEGLKGKRENVSVLFRNKGVESNSPEACVESLKEAYRSSTSQRDRNNKKSYWWNQDIAAKREECNQLRRQTSRALGRRDIPEQVKAQLKPNYKNEKKTLEKLIKTSKREHWRILRISSPTRGRTGPRHCRTTVPSGSIQKARYP